MVLISLAVIILPSISVFIFVSNRIHSSCLRFSFVQIYESGKKDPNKKAAPFGIGAALALFFSLSFVGCIFSKTKRPVYHGGSGIYDAGSFILYKQTHVFWKNYKLKILQKKHLAQVSSLEDILYSQLLWIFARQNPSDATGGGGGNHDAGSIFADKIHKIYYNLSIFYNVEIFCQILSLYQESVWAYRAFFILSIPFSKSSIDAPQEMRK